MAYRIFCTNPLSEPILLACPLLGTKPLPEPILTYCQLYHWKQASVTFKAKPNDFLKKTFRNVVCKMTTVFVQAPVCQERHFAWALWRLKSLVHRLFVKHSFRLPRRKAGGLPSQRACTAENVSMSWYHCGFDSSPPGWNGTKIADDNFKCNWETWVNGHTVTHFGRCQATTQLNYSGYQLQLTHPWLNKIF